MKKIKILFLIPNLMHGGAEKVLVNLVNNLDADKFDVTVQTIFDVGVHKKSLLKHIHYKSVFKYQFKGNSKMMSLFAPKTLHKLFIKEKYDIEVAYLEGPAARIISGCKNKETKKIAVIHTEYTDKALFAQGFRNVTEAQECYKKFDTVAAVSKVIETAFLKNMHGENVNTAVKYNVNEVEQIIEKSTENVEDELFKENEVNFITTGKIVPVKGFDRLAKVHKRLLKEEKKHKIYVLGVGEEQAKVERYLEENGLKDSFVFLGFKENPYKYVSRADVYVCSSHREGFSTAVTEALIVGTPVVTTLCSGMEEMLGKNNEYGIIAENSEDGLYDGMKRMIEDSELRKYYADKAKERAEIFSRINTVRAYEEMFEELLKI